jgi:Zn-dependent protease
MSGFCVCYLVSNVPPVNPRQGSEPPISGTAGTVTLLGVPVRLHFTFVLFLIFLIFVGLGSRQSGPSFVVYVLALFGSVILHELGHAMVARMYGIRTVDITMFPIGGVSRLEATPPPNRELWIALAGPLVNVLIAGILVGVLYLRHHPIDLARLLDPSDANLVERIAAGNLILALFNLLPAFPMDGGRVLRAFLARSRSLDDASRIAAAAGRMLAIAMGLYGLLAMQFLLVFIAFFVYLGAAQEGAAATGRSLTHGIPVKAAMVTDFRTLPHGSTVRDAANLLLATSQQDFPVMHGNEVIGLLQRNNLLRALAAEGPDAYISGSMDRDFTVLDPDMDLAEALPAMSAAGTCALVMRDGALLGLLTSENLTEFLLLRRFGMQPAPAR